MDSFDDNRLRDELESRGQTIGPIVDSTRQLYRRLLKRLIEEEVYGMDDRQDSDEELDTNTDNTSSGLRPKTSDNRLDTESKAKPKSKILLFLFSLILCIIFAYFYRK